MARADYDDSGESGDYNESGSEESAPGDGHEIPDDWYDLIDEGWEVFDIDVAISYGGGE